VTAVIVERAILGNQPLFRVPAYSFVNPMELIAYGALGGIGGLVSVAFCKGLLALRSLFKRLPKRTEALQPAIGGLLIGALLVFRPEVMGVGYEYVDQALNGGLVLRMLIVLCAAKFVATIVSYASGNAGGIFAPSLFLGAMTGGAVGVLIQRLSPFPTADPGAYALVGMGTLFAGIIRAPMTSVFMIFELTQDYQVLVPLMIANLLSFLISKELQPVPVYHALLQQDQVELPGPESRLATGTWRARDIMTRDLLSIPSETSIQQASIMTENNGQGPFMVVTGQQLVGLVDSRSMREALSLGKGSDPITAIVMNGWMHVHPDHPLELALERLGQGPGLVPVLKRGPMPVLEGAITPESVLNFVQRRSRE